MRYRQNIVSAPGWTPSVIANVAVARELAGWCWSLAVLDDTVMNG